MNDQFKKWSTFYTEADQKILRYPNEPLARVMKGDYIPDLNKNYKGKKVLDIGFGHGNNLLFLNTLGFELYGTEVQEEICLLVMDRLKSFGISSDLRYGINQELPFIDNMFEAVVSWDVLHYEAKEDNINLALKEYMRVLVPGGRLFLSTVAPKSSVLRDAQDLGENCFLLKREDDFRKGISFYCCESQEKLKTLVSTHFKNVMVGRSTERLFSETYDSYILTGIK